MNHINYFENSHSHLRYLTSNDFLNPIEALSYGNIDPELYLGYKNYKVKMVNPTLDNVLKSYLFAMIELNLYLDTHPNDSNAVNLFNNYSKDFKVILEQYENENGVLSILSNKYNNKWNYAKNWPWERGNK